MGMTYAVPENRAFLTNLTYFRHDHLSRGNLFLVQAAFYTIKAARKATGGPNTGRNAGSRRKGT